MRNAMQERALSGAGNNFHSYVYPNCLAVDENGRTYVGDASGMINVWDFEVDSRREEVLHASAKNHFLIRHKELENDEINCIMIEPTQQKQIIVHSRDNCIRIMEVDPEMGHKVKRRLFGA